MDAGGLFKEFWTDLSALAFNMDFGLFRTTATDGTLYPNPSAEALQVLGRGGGGVSVRFEHCSFLFLFFLLTFSLHCLCFVFCIFPLI
jgi:hypothetical protein